MPVRFSQAAGWLGMGVAVYGIATLAILLVWRLVDRLRGRVTPEEGLKQQTDRVKSVVEEDRVMRDRLTDILQRRERGPG